MIKKFEQALFLREKLIFAILLVGVIYRFTLTWDGNFLFNMDNARDFVDVREMVELGKLRLTGPTAAIEGLYNGPLWYYLLAIPYIITGGDPYSAIIMEIILWAIGGFFLLKLVKSFGKMLILPIGLVWVASNYIVLANLYSFNPNPVVLLTPFFIYGLVEYLKGKKIWIIPAWFLAGSFFNFEMNFGVFTPLIILICIYLLNKKYYKDKYFWIGITIFIGTLLPQLLFDLRHDFIMSKSIMRFLSENKDGEFNIFKRLPVIWDSFYNVFQATMVNQKLLSWLILILAVPAFKFFLSKGRKDIIVLATSAVILIPFTGYLLIPVTVNAWHLGGFAASSLVFIAFILSNIWQFNFFGKIFTLSVSVSLVFYSILNIANFFINDFGKPGRDPSLYKNEIAAIDYVYKYANGQNFKVYTYLPSVYDYPYQYLFWWYGTKKYGYIPAEYTYSPNKPKYIPSQDKFQGRKDNFSGLVFLIKEPDRNYTRSGWEGAFVKLETIDKQMVGPIEVEIKKEL